MTLQTAPGSVDVRPPPAAVRMNPGERRATASLASIYGLRLLGMFIILPVFALYAETLPGGASHTLIGIALGAYGLTQALLQIPFGWASDRWGRKPVIYIGLAIFAFGSFLAAWAPTIASVRRASDQPCRRVVTTLRPLRNTVARSQRVRTSAKRCET